MKPVERGSRSPGPGRQIGIAMPALIDSAVRATTRHSENALSASDAATASINRVDATGALWPPKPVAPYDRVMVRGPQRGWANHHYANQHRDRRRHYWGSPAAKSPQVLRIVND